MRKKKSERKPRKPEVPLTAKQSRFAEAFAKTRSLKLAALEAGYSPKNPSQSGAQALADIREKSPEAMMRLGLSLETVIKKHLNPLLNATETKFFQHEGKVTDFVEVEDNSTRLGATRTALELLNAFPPKDPQLAAQVGVEVIVLDVVRPDRSAINVTPVNGKPTVKAKPPAGNGAKPDPRPEQ